MTDLIRIRGARTNNLKNIDVDIPRNTLTVITGLSGSGKSSLAFDTIYAEGQRRYVESLSAYARQFLGLMEKPDVDSIDGLSPAISIDQKSTSRNPRSTVGTVTEIYDYLRLLFAKVGVAHCPKCDKEVTRQTPSQIVDAIAALPEGSKILICAPVVVGKKGEHTAVLEKIKKDGFVRYRLDGQVLTVNENPTLDPKKMHTIEIVVDRLVVKDFAPKVQTLSTGETIEQPNPARTRLTDSVEIALKQSGGSLKVVGSEDTKIEELFSENFACADCNISLPEVAPRMFSFNSPHGACPECHGLGETITVDPDEVFPNPKLSLEEGAIQPWANLGMEGWYMQILHAVAEAHGVPLDKPVGKLTAAQRALILAGTGDETYGVTFPGGGHMTAKFEGVVPNLVRRYRESESDFVRSRLEKYMISCECPACHGSRLRPEVLGIRLGEKNIVGTTELDIATARTFFRELKLNKTQTQIAHLILQEIDARLGFLENVGLTYLTLNRSANTLSGGEAQRIRLATQIGSKLQGVLYVLDEPSIGLHQRDNDRLIETLLDLKKLGNTVLVVEHDEDIMRTADYLVDIGPGAGKHGGQVIAAGTPAELMADPNCLTGQYLSGRKTIAIPTERRAGNGKTLKVLGAREHNLRNINVDFPLGTLIGVSGVSGSGKSSLVNSILANHLTRELNRSKAVTGECDAVLGVENLDKAIVIDQGAIGRTPRSNAATYTGLFTDIRNIFAEMPEAKMRGYKTGRFSFNVKGGRCEACQGDGLKKIEMHFLPDIYVPCEECNGARYNRETLEIRYRSKNIAEVLNLTVEDALEFFTAQPAIKNKLQTMSDVGLGYIHLGQSATTLSGGEAQRIKLATELAKRATGKTLYILDEPTTGLHFDDVARLIVVLQRLVESGNTVLTIEHNLDVLKCCDHLIDIGPEGGSGGGQVVATGTPEAVAQVKDSFTGQYLAKMLKNGKSLAAKKGKK